MALETLKNYIDNTYKHLANLITDKQYEQIDWIDTSNQSNERLATTPNETQIHSQQQRIFARLHFLFLLKQGEETAYLRFINGQNEPKLIAAHFKKLSELINNLSEFEFKLLWVATLTFRSPKAIELAKTAMKETPPFDGVDFLAKVMTTTPEIYPAAAELMEQDNSAKSGFNAMFDTGHFRHMMYVEGGPKMFGKLRAKIENKMQQKELNLWFSYWLIDITGFRAQTKELGSAYFNENTYEAASTLMNHISFFFENPKYPILYEYLNDRAKWLGLGTSNLSQLFPNTYLEIPRLILARIAAMQRLFSSDEKEGLLRGLSRLNKKLGDKNYNELTEILNPLQETEEPTTTYGPLLLANLRAKSNYEDAIVFGLPIYAKALAMYRQLREDNKIDKSIPLNLNDLATPDNIQAILNGGEFSVSIDPSNGTTKLEPIKLENRLENVKCTFTHI